MYKSFRIRTLLISVASISIATAWVDYRVRIQLNALREIRAIDGQAFDQRNERLTDSYSHNLCNSLDNVSIDNIKLDTKFIAALENLPNLNFLEIKGGDFEKVDLPTVNLIRARLPSVRIKNGYVNLLDAFERERSVR